MNKKITILAYILGAEHNPNKLSSQVPWKLNEELIFFGSCKKPIRKDHYEKYLMNNDLGVANLEKENIHLLGFNASPKKNYHDFEKRKILWFGKILKAMTYEKAYTCFNSDLKYKELTKKMMQHDCSPLNFTPIYSLNQNFRGYKYIKNLHKKNDAWIQDITSKNFIKDDKTLSKKNRKLILSNSAKREEVFIKDCVYLCSNEFFAEGEGIKINKKIIELLKNAQPGKKKIDAYKIFGETSNHSANGLHGKHLEITGEIAKKLKIEIKKNANLIRTRKETEELSISKSQKC